MSLTKRWCVSATAFTWEKLEAHFQGTFCFLQWRWYWSKAAFKNHEPPWATPIPVAADKKEKRYRHLSHFLSFIFLPRDFYCLIIVLLYFSCWLRILKYLSNCLTAVWYNITRTNSLQRPVFPFIPSTLMPERKYNKHCQIFSLSF